MQLDNFLIHVPFLASIFVVAITCFCAFAFESRKNRLPPSPPRRPFIGNLHQLSSLPHRSLSALSNKYGPLMLLKFGQFPTLVVSSSKMAREIMEVHDHNFANRPTLSVPSKLLYQGKDIAFAPYGYYWRQMRKVAVLHLLSSKRVQSFKTIREEEVGFMIAKVLQSSTLGTINMTEILNSFANDIITRIALGRCLKEEKWSDVHIGKLIEEMSRLLGTYHWADYFPCLSWISKLNGLDAKINTTFAKGDELLDKIVHNYTDKDNSDGSETFVDILLSLETELSRIIPFDKQNIKAIIEDTVGAGTDSTYISMEWVMAELIRNVRVMKKLKQEIELVANSQPVITEENLGDMNYLKAVIKETYRLHPPGPLLVPRESMQDTEINGYKIARNTRVLVNAWAIGRDPDVWDDPENFIPERFLDSNIDFRGRNFELIPFGAGRRICPGIQFASVIVELAIANLVHQFTWMLPCNMNGEDIDMDEAPGLTCRKNVNLNLIATPCF